MRAQVSTTWEHAAFGIPWRKSHCKSLRARAFIISRLIIELYIYLLVTAIKGLITLLTKSHDPPSRVLRFLYKEFTGCFEGSGRRGPNN